MRALLITYTGLLILLALTIAASYIHLGSLAVFVSLGIALVKAVLIALFFMQLNRASTLVRLAAIAGLPWLTILLLLSFADFAERESVPAPSPDVSAHPTASGPGYVEPAPTR